MSQIFAKIIVKFLQKLFEILKLKCLTLKLGDHDTSSGITFNLNLD